MKRIIFSLKYAFHPFFESLIVILACFVLQVFSISGCVFKDYLTANVRYASSYLEENCTYVVESGQQSEMLKEQIFEEHQTDYFTIDQGHISVAYAKVDGQTKASSITFFAYSNVSVTNYLGNKELLLGDYSGAVISEKMCHDLLKIDSNRVHECLEKDITIMNRDREIAVNVRISGVYKEKAYPSLLSPVYSSSLKDNQIVFCPESLLNNIFFFDVFKIATRIEYKQGNNDLQVAVESMAKRYSDDIYSKRININSSMNKYKSLFLTLDLFTAIAIPFAFVAQLSILISNHDKKKNDESIVLLYRQRVSSLVFLRTLYCFSFVFAAVGLSCSFFFLLSALVSSYLGTVGLTIGTLLLINNIALIPVLVMLLQRKKIFF